MLSVPDVVRRKALAYGAAQWLDDLPALVEGFADEWSFQVGRTLAGGTESLVVEGRLEGGAPAVLKLLIPQDDDAHGHEITFLRLAAGNGCAELFRSDDSRGAMLMERLGRPLHGLHLPIGQRHEILCAAASRIWRPAPGSGLPTGAEQGRWLIDFITVTWEELDRPCSERAVAHAVACARRRTAAHDDERAVLVHGDVHAWNALEAGDGFKLIDPNGLLAEAEYDLGILMREDPVELLEGGPWERARRLAALTGRDATAIWEWGVVERVSTGLLCTQVEMQPIGRDMLRVADALAE